MLPPSGLRAGAAPPARHAGQTRRAARKRPQRAVKPRKARNLFVNRPSARCAAAGRCSIIRADHDDASRRLPRRHTLWVGFVAVLAPLLVLLGLQYRWLVKLDQASEKIHKATLDNYPRRGGGGRRVALQLPRRERVLNLPPDVFTEHDLEKAAHYFKKKGATGAKRLFVVSFVGGEGARCCHFDPELRLLAGRSGRRGARRLGRHRSLADSWRTRGRISRRPR